MLSGLWTVPKLSPILPSHAVTDTNFKIAGVGDFNNDGKGDILWRHATSGTNVIWLMNGASLISSTAIPTVTDTNFQIAAIADFNGDDKSDILWRHATSENKRNLVNGRKHLIFQHGLTYSRNQLPGLQRQVTLTIPTITAIFSGVMVPTAQT